MNVNLALGGRPITVSDTLLGLLRVILLTDTQCRFNELKAEFRGGWAINICNLECLCCRLVGPMPGFILSSSGCSKYWPCRPG